MSQSEPFADDPEIYKVVVNHEEQYSIWPEYRENPPGWKNAGYTGNKAGCLEFIRGVWTDMRPLSVRKRMTQATDSAPGQSSNHE
jgi:MbtH protein